MSEKKHDWRSALDEVVRDKRRERGSHPDHATLVDYHSGRLPPEAEKQVRHHLVLCRRCAKLLLEFDAFTAEAADPSQESSPPGDESKPKRRWWWTPLAAAAVLLLIVLAWPSADPLPIYTGRLSGQVQPTRDADSDQGDMAVHVFPSGGRLVLRLQPQTALQEMPTARAYLRHDGDLRALSASVVEVRRDGVVSLEGELGTDLILPQGRSELIVVV
ncbi:MAG TPA: hypothetical protein VLV83_16775, partial [Acidobacteriota bacterium]|nr:hypothetical protein [Acidobacteriota bacterium]